MATRLSKSDLLDRIIAAVRASGWDAVILSDEHPFRLVILRSGQRIQLLCYIWNLTHGGYPRDPNELRIQITGVSRFRVEDGVKTLVLGWNEDDEMFAAFDVTRHLISMHGRSPSFQIRRETLTAAEARGFFPQIRGNEEIAIAFRPDFFATYAEQMESLHQTAKHAADVKNLETIAGSEKKVEIKDVPPGPRKTVLEQIQRKVRDARFRGNVLAAYENRCSVSGMQLDLLEAAHIIPVEHKRGTDEVRNGLSLTVLHHRAFDHGLIGIKSDYSIIVNDREMARLRRIGWDGGEKAFRATLRDQILLPPRREHYPEPDYLVFGQRLRGWRERALR